MTGRALVLGGGGLTGIAWETGLLHGLAEEGVDLRDADVIIGTSAGSTVAAQVSSGTPLEELYAAQRSEETAELSPRITPLTLAPALLGLVWPPSLRGIRARIGRAALLARTVTEDERRAVIAQRLPSHDWPEQRLLLPAVDARSGKPVVFDNDSGVELVDAVAASCAVPLVWPPATIDGRRYIDGAVRSVANVDLAKGCDRVAVIVPSASSLVPSGRPQTQLDALGERIRSVLVEPQAEARAAFGRNPLEPSRRGPAAEAGRAQARACIQQVRAVWEGA